MKPTQVIAGLVLLVVGVALGRLLAPDADVAGREDLERQVAEARAARATAEAGLDSAESRLRDMERDLAALRRERTRVEPATDAVEPSPETPTKAADTADPATDEASASDVASEHDLHGYPAFVPTDEKVTAVLDDIDWKSNAEHMTAMLPLLAEIAASLEKDEPPSPQAAGNVQMHNGPLVITAMTLANKGVPGTGANGSFTHPSFVVNSVAANLAALDMPLDKAQHAKLAAIGRDFEARDAKRLASYPEDALTMRKLVDEVELKADMYDSIFQILSQEQHDALSPPAVRGRTSLDLHCEGLVWAGRMRLMGYRDHAHLVELVEQTFMSAVDEASKDRAHDIVVRWVDALPAEILDWQPDALAKKGMLPARHATACAHHVLALQESLLRDGDMGERAVAAVRASQGTIVPFRTEEGP